MSTEQKSVCSMGFIAKVSLNRLRTVSTNRLFVGFCTGAYGNIFLESRQNSSIFVSFLLIRVGGVFPKTPEMIPKDKDYKLKDKRKKEKT